MRDLAADIEHLLERSLPDKKLVTNMQRARQLIAKSYTIEDALHGSSVDARKLGNQLKRKPLSGELRAAAEFGQQHRKFAAVPDGAKGGNWAAEALLSGVGGAAGYGAGDHPLAFGAGALALPMARRGAVAMLRRVYERAARQGNKEITKHAARVAAMQHGAMTAGKAQLIKQSIEELYHAGIIEDPAEVLVDPITFAAFIGGKYIPKAGRRVLRKSAWDNFSFGKNDKPAAPLRPARPAREASSIEEQAEHSIGRRAAETDDAAWRRRETIRPELDDDDMLDGLL